MLTHSLRLPTDCKLLLCLRTYYTLTSRRRPEGPLALRGALR